MDETNNQAPDGQRLLQVRITNNNEFAIKDRFNGVLYKFEPGKPVQCNPEVAGHIFGFKPWPGNEQEVELAMIRYCAKRHGWNTPEDAGDVEGNGMEEAKRRFALIDIQPVRFKLVEENDQPRRDRQAG